MTVSTPDLAGLLARVEVAEGWSRDLDTEIAWAVLEKDWSGDDWEAAERRPQFTNSLDAALTLCERVLQEPWQHITLERNGRHSGFSGFLGCHDAFAKTPALALLAAMLRTLIAQGQDGTARSSQPTPIE